MIQAAEIIQFDNLAALWNRLRAEKRMVLRGDVWLNSGSNPIKMSGCWQVMARRRGYELMRREINEANRPVWVSIVMAKPESGEAHFIAARGEIITLSPVEAEMTKKARR
jgi:hypothetical protein